MDTDVQFRVHETVLILVHQSAECLFQLLSISHLSSSVDDFREECLTFVDNLMAKGIFDGRIVTFDEMAFTVLHRERRFPYAEVSVTVHMYTKSASKRTNRSTAQDRNLSLFDRRGHDCANCKGIKSKPVGGRLQGNDRTFFLSLFSPSVRIRVSVS